MKATFGYVMVCFGVLCFLLCSVSFAFNTIYTTGTTGEIQIIDVSTFKVSKNIQVGGTLLEMVINPRDFKIYVADAYNDEVVVIDRTEDYVIEERIPVGVGARLITVSRDGSRIYVMPANENRLYVIDPLTNPKEVWTIDDEFELKAIDMEIGKSGKYLFIAYERHPKLSVVDVDDESLFKDLQLESPVQAIDIGTDGLLYAACPGGDQVAVVDTEELSVTKYIKLPSGYNPRDIKVGANNEKIYVLSNEWKKIGVFDIIEGTEGTLLADALADGTKGIELDEANLKVYYPDVAASRIMRANMNDLSGVEYVSPISSTWDIDGYIAGNEGGVTGRVLTNVAGMETPILDAKVSLVETGGAKEIVQSQTTDKDGRYYLTGVSPGVYDLLTEANPKYFKSVSGPEVIVEQERLKTLNDLIINDLKFWMDCDGDLQISLSEIIYGLQVIAGVR